MSFEDEEALSNLRPTLRDLGGDATWRDADSGRVRTLLGIGSPTRRVLAALKKNFDPRGRLPPLPIEE